MKDDLGAPLFEAETGDDGWSCRLLDRHGLLRASKHELPRDMAFGASPKVADACRKVGGGGSEWFIGDWRSARLDGPGIPDEKLLSLILAVRLLDFVVDVDVDEALEDVDDPRIWVDPAVLRCRDVLRRHEPEGELRSFVLRVIREAAEARASLDPFVSRLDLRAVMLLRGRSPLSWPDVPILPLSPGRGPLAPLAAALAWEPRFPQLLSTLACGLAPGCDDMVLPLAVVEGPGATRALVRGCLRAGVPGQPDFDVACLRSADALSRLDASDVGRVEAALDKARRNEGTERASRSEDPVRHAARLLAHLPPDWVPGDAPSWLAFVACAPAIELVTRRAAPPHVARLLGAGGDWPGLLSSLTAAHGGKVDDLSHAVRDVADLTVAYDRQVLVPAHVLCGGQESSYLDGAAATILLSGRGMRRVLELSRRWHAARRHMLEGLPPPLGAPSSWPRAWPDATIGDVTVSEVTDRAGLEEEGADGPGSDGVPGLAHCVGGYAPDCLSGGSRILSLRAPDGTRLSTAQVTWDGARMRVVQHSGHRNALPPDGAVLALQGYAEGVGTGRLRVDEAALAPLAQIAGIEAKAGYDVTVPGAWETMRDRWAPFVPRTFRGTPMEAHAAVIVRETAVGTNARWGRDPVRP